MNEPPIPAVQTFGLTRMYGNIAAVSQLDLTVNKGDLFGFIGSNGAGKTTTLRILATFLAPSAGTAQILGRDVVREADAVRHVIGYMPDFFGVYDDMKVIEYLDFFAATYRIKGEARRKRCEEVLELVDLGYKRDAFVTSLSRGMTQRLGLARVLLHEPQVLLLDEPASGLDPRARIEIRGLLKELRSLGKTIMVSSHILPELADICNKVGIIERGELLVNSDVADVMRQVRSSVVLKIQTAGETDRAAKLLSYHSSVAAVDVAADGEITVKLKPEVVDYSDLPTLLVAAGVKLRAFKPEEINLETAFMELTKGITA